MNVPIYQYSKELKKWIWLCNMHSYDNLNIPLFPVGCFSYLFWNYSLRKTNIHPNFIDNVKTITLV